MTRNEHTRGNPIGMILIAAVGLLVLLGLPIVFFSNSPVVPTASIKEGHVLVHVEFRGLSTKERSHLRQFVHDLAAEHAIPLDPAADKPFIGNYNTYSNFWDNGFVDQHYKPKHAIPNPRVEREMQARLAEYLETNGLDGKAELSLLYGE